MKIKFSGMMMSSVWLLCFSRPLLRCIRTRLNPIWTGGRGKMALPEGFGQISQKSFNRTSPNFLTFKVVRNKKIENLNS